MASDDIVGQLCPVDIDICSPLACLGIFPTRKDSSYRNCAGSRRIRPRSRRHIRKLAFHRNRYRCHRYDRCQWNRSQFRFHIGHREIGPSICTRWMCCSIGCRFRHFGRVLRRKGLSEPHNGTLEKDIIVILVTKKTE